MKRPTEIELKFQVPPASRAALLQELARGGASFGRSTLAAHHLDTPDRLLSRAGLVWRLRREGRRWIQTLQATGPDGLARFEHEVIRREASVDASLHAGIPAGERLLEVLRRARARGTEPELRFQTALRRTSRRIRTRGAVVEVSFDEGRLLAADRTLRIREVAFELVDGSPMALLALAERWRQRFGLVVDPRSRSERGDLLAQGHAHPPVRKALPLACGRGATAAETHGAALDECLAQITRNAIGLSEGDPALRVAHVHQLRVGIRRLRSALRSFEGWVPAAPTALVDGLRSLFATLGQARDSDVMGSGVMAELARVGAPPLTLPPMAQAPDGVAAIVAAATQKTLLGWITWRASLREPGAVRADTGPVGAAGQAPPAAGAPAGDTALAAAGAPSGDARAPRAFGRSAERRLRKWHVQVVAAADGFDTLDEPAIHALRKRIKRLRYAVEFFAPVLRDGQVRRYLRALAALQDHMGDLNDLFVARARYQALVADDPAAWFALGWLAARIAGARAGARPVLARLAKTAPPTA